MNLGVIMLDQSLRDIIHTIQKLIETTKLDIQSLAQADNEPIFQRLALKETLLKEFDKQKNLIDSQMLALKNKHPNQEFAEVLGQDILDLLDQFKQSLQELKELNHGYARSVYAVSEFYTSLLRKIVPHENLGYGGYAKPQQSFLTIQV